MSGNPGGMSGGRGGMSGNPGGMSGGRGGMSGNPGGMSGGRGGMSGNPGGMPGGRGGMSGNPGGMSGGRGGMSGNPGGMPGGRGGMSGNPGGMPGGRGGMSGSPGGMSGGRGISGTSSKPGISSIPGTGNSGKTARTRGSADNSRTRSGIPMQPGQITMGNSTNRNSVRDPSRGNYPRAGTTAGRGTRGSGARGDYGTRHSSHTAHLTNRYYGQRYGAKTGHDDHYRNGHNRAGRYYDNYRYGARDYGNFYLGRYGYGFGYYGSGFSIGINVPYAWYGGYYSAGYCPEVYSAGYAFPGYDLGYYLNTVSGPGELLVDPPAEAVPVLENFPSEPATAEMRDSSTVVPVTENATEFQLQAEQAFRDGDYEEAARMSNHAMVEDAGNGKLHLFAAQVLFAVGEYEMAAAAIYQAAGLLEPEERGFVVENFGQLYRGDDYVTQMDQLNQYVRENPEAAFASFLRGYHFLFLGHADAARKDFEKTLKLQPDDRLAREFLTRAGGNSADPLPAPAPPPPPDQDDSLMLIDNESNG